MNHIAPSWGCLFWRGHLLSINCCDYMLWSYLISTGSTQYPGFCAAIWFIVVKSLFRGHCMQQGCLSGCTLSGFCFYVCACLWICVGVSQSICMSSCPSHSTIRLKLDTCPTIQIYLWTTPTSWPHLTNMLLMPKSTLRDQTWVYVVILLTHSVAATLFLNMVVMNVIDSRFTSVLWPHLAI